MPRTVLVTGALGQIIIVAMLLGAGLGFYALGAQVLAGACVGAVTSMLVVPPLDRGRATDVLPRVVRRRTPVQGVPTGKGDD